MFKTKTGIVQIDAETSFMLLADFQLKNHGYISPSNIVQDWSIYCVAWKFLDGPRTYSSQVDISEVKNDYKVCSDIREVLQDTKLLVGHNLDKFDLKKLNTRFIYHGIEPVDHKILTFDTLKAAKKHFCFSSNKLDYLANYLGVGRKLPHSHSDWFKLLTDPDQTTLDFMVKYCKHDVNPLLEGVHLKLKPYVDYPNLTGRLKGDDYICTHCGSTDYMKWGFKYSKAGKKIQRYQCNACRGWGQEAYSELDEDGPTEVIVL